MLFILRSGNTYNYGNAHAQKETIARISFAPSVAVTVTGPNVQAYNIIAVCYTIYIYQCCSSDIFRGKGIDSVPKQLVLALDSVVSSSVSCRQTATISE